MAPMNNRIISSWVRQARYRAKSNGIYTDLEVEDVQEIIQHFDRKCAYCGAEATCLDHPFPLKTSAPNVPANTVPCCKSCRDDKRVNDIVWMFAEGFMTQERYLDTAKFMLSLRGGKDIKKFFQMATGINDDTAA